MAHRPAHDPVRTRDKRAGAEVIADVGSSFSMSKSLPSEGTKCPLQAFERTPKEEAIMGRGILLWLLGVPIPIIILVLLFWHH